MKPMNDNRLRSFQPLQFDQMGAHCLKRPECPMNSRIYIHWFLLAPLLLVIPNVPAAELTRAMFQGKDFQPSIYGEGNKGYVFEKSQRWDPKKVPGYSLGYAEFAVHEYKLTPAMIYTINFGLANLVRSHQTVFQRNVGRDFRIRFRIFGNYEDYKEYSKKRHRNEVSKNLLGFFSPKANEIVTWKQESHLTWRLVPTLLHEGCHAIMHEMFGQLPFWMIEGSADWLGEAPAWIQKSNGLRDDQHQRWVRLNSLRKTGRLPNLKEYLLSSDYEHWKQMFDGNIGMGYDIGWSIFDFFMRTHTDATKFLGAVVNDKAVLAARGRDPAPLARAFEQAINRNWGGPKYSGKGTLMLERGWHSWIQKKAFAAEKELLKTRRRRQ